MNASVSLNYDKGAERSRSGNEGKVFLTDSGTEKKNTNIVEDEAYKFIDANDEKIALSLSLSY
ncbi:hypothetical protein DICVIV_09524 [Dictyocaulus viviparus]|uniref:Uncharacterized protein n=1 Tax=Dictyocaulus viviparus TaxID=29172 RepID=A0A0D8XIH0_DICVI|nr:hypothetical protein DICVIV_09524 [Dictyocaulus viviparus]